MDSTCVICRCRIHRGGKDYGKPTLKERSHATTHHYVAKRFSSRSNSKGKPREPIFNLKNYPPQWEKQEKDGQFCYECHEELLHNPVFLDTDISQFAKLVKLKNLNESEKPGNKDRIAGRIVLLHEVIEKGIKAILAEK